MPLAGLNLITREVEVVTKGGKVTQDKINPKTLGPVRSYLRLPRHGLAGGVRHRDGQGDQLLGRPHDLAAHPEALGRQSPGQPSDPPLLWPRDGTCGSIDRYIQNMLGHESDKMARHYAREAASLPRPT